MTGLGAIILILVIVILSIFYGYTERKPFTNYGDEFRYALSVSPFSARAFDNGYTYQIGDNTISTVKDLEKYYMSIGATEMYTRIATKRHVTAEDITYGKEDTNANIHTLDQGLELCRLSAELNIPINPEIMCAYTYMDVENAQAPNFEEYPEIYAMQNGKDWSELTLDEMLPILEAYGKFVATEILNTGCRVNCWNIGNEANFGFAGVGIGIKTAVNPKLEGVGFGKYIHTIFNKNWFVKNLWKYNAKQMAAVQNGILSAYAELGKNSEGVQFSTHIATVLATPESCVKYFNTLKDNGFNIDVAGISFYPSAPAIFPDEMILFKKVVTAIYEKCNLPIFIAEFAYPSGEMSGPYAGWNKKCGKYDMSEAGQKKIFDDVISWGRTHGVIGLRYWAADYEDWGTMGMFNFNNKVGTPKEILKDR